MLLEATLTEVLAINWYNVQVFALSNLSEIGSIPNLS